MMSYRLIPSLLVLISLAFSATAEELSFEEWIEQERETRHIPAIGLAIIQGGEIVFAEGFGHTDLETGKEATGETIFRVGSVSKTVTATALLHLIENSDLALETDLRRHFEDLPLRPRLDRALTPHHLLTHTCGLNERLFGQHVQSKEGLLSLENYLQQHLPPRFEEPGKVISYNDYCTVLAGLAIERISGQSFETYVAENVAAPLGLMQTTFDQTVSGQDFESNLAKSYHFDGNTHKAYERDFIHTTPGAGLYTTPEDMAIFLDFLINGNDDVLSEDALQEQVTIQERNHEKLPGRAYGFASMVHGGETVLYKDGQASGFSARLLIIPETGDGFFIVQNRSIFGQMGAINKAGRLPRDFTSFFLKTVLPDDHMDHEREEPMEIDGDVTPYIGSYRNTVAARHSFEKIITLMDDVVITENPEGGINMGSNRFVMVGPHLFQHASGSEWYVAFSPPEDGGKPSYFFIGGGSYERVSALRNSKNAPIILGVILLTTFVVLIIASIMSLKRTDFRAHARMIFLSSLLKLSGVVGIAGAFIFIDLQAFFFGMPPALKLALVAPLAAILIDLILLKRWVSYIPQSSFQTLLFWAHIMASASLMLWLADWNLLGWRLG